VVAAEEHELLAYAPARLAEIPGLRLTGTAPRKARYSLIRLTRCTRTTSARSWIATALPFVTVTIAVSRDGEDSGCPRPYGHRWRFTTRARHRRAGGRVAQGAGGFHVSDDDLQTCIKSDPRPQPPPRNYCVLDGARTARGIHPLSATGLSVYVRIDDGVISDVTFQGSGCAISKASAVADDGKHQRQDDRRGGPVFHQFSST